MALVLFLLWLWQPERQVRLHTSHFLKEVERRDWEDAGKFLARDYSDRWDHTKESAISDAREVFRSFLFLTIENRTDKCDIAGDRATTNTVIKISGSGSPIAQMIMERVNGLHGPFVFGWRQASWKPWDWELTRVDHPDLRTERFEGL